MTCTRYQYKSDQINEDEMGRSCGTGGQKKNTYRILVGEHGINPLTLEMDI